VAALARRISSRHDVEIGLDVEAADGLGENAALALYQILREATEQAVRRGPLTRIEIAVRATDAGGVELIVADDGPPERRAAVLEALAERAATLNGRFASEIRYPRGSTVRIEVPPAAAHR
jgi:nitrate/nitrite-specific signal transduction histidine kinase